MSNENTALAEIETRPYRGLAMAMAPAESARRLQELQGFIKTTMKKGEDYGRIPGTDKDTLFQPGAQKLAELYGLAHKFVTAEAIKDWEKGFFYFEFRCELTSLFRRKLRRGRDGELQQPGIEICRPMGSRDRASAFTRSVDATVPRGRPMGLQERDPGGLDPS